MAAVGASKSTKYTTLGTAWGAESNVLVESTDIDLDSNIDFSTLNADEVEVRIVSASAATGSPSIVFTLQGWNPAAAAYEDLIVSAAVTAAGNTKLLIGANVVPVANVAAACVVREKLRLKIDYTGTPDTDQLNAVTVAVYAS